MVVEVPHWTSTTARPDPEVAVECACREGSFDDCMIPEAEQLAPKVGLSGDVGCGAACYGVPHQ